LYCGARVDFVDIDPRTFNLCPVALEKKLMQAQATGTLPKIVVAVHMCGQPCDMRAIHALSVQYGFKVIEDASHAIGAKYLGEPVGNCRFSDITVFSFHPVKIITTAEGGMAMTQDKQLATKMRALRSHGISSGADEMVATPENEIWNYQQHSLGFNYRMTELQAALGLSQMDRLDSFVQTRHALAEKYNQAAWSDAIEKPWQHADAYSSFHLYIIKISPTQPHVTQRLVYEGLLAAGIRANLHYIPVYRQPFYAEMGFSKGYCPHAEAYFQQAISIPLYADLQQDDQNFVSRVMDKLTCAHGHDSDPVTEPTESGAL
jgi:dTDP-4-amino-4,6-dideoxygalactose transaminase